MSNWILHHLGFWDLLTLLVGAGVFVWSVCQAIRTAEVRLLGVHGAVLLVPLFIGLIAGTLDCIPVFEVIRLIDDARMVTIPSALVLTIARFFRLSTP